MKPLSKRKRKPLASGPPGIPECRGLSHKLKNRSREDSPLSVFPFFIGSIFGQCLSKRYNTNRERRRATLFQASESDGARRQSRAQQLFNEASSEARAGCAKRARPKVRISPACESVVTTSGCTFILVTNLEHQKFIG